MKLQQMGIYGIIYKIRQQKTAGYRWAFEEEVMQNVSNGNR